MEEQIKSEDQKEFIVMTPDQFREVYETAAKIGAEKALDTFNKERAEERKHRRKRKLRNTELLLRNYHMLKENAENSVFGRSQMEESAADILEEMMSLYNDEVIVESIKNSATRTAIIMSHVDTMISLYHTYCERAENSDIEMRRYDVLWDRYLADEPLNVESISKKHHMTKQNVYADLKIATERFTALIFGVDGLSVR